MSLSKVLGKCSYWLETVIQKTLVKHIYILKTIYWAVVEMYGEETSLFSSSLSGHQVILAACLYEKMNNCGFKCDV